MERLAQPTSELNMGLLEESLKFLSETMPWPMMRNASQTFGPVAPNITTWGNTAKLMAGHEFDSPEYKQLIKLAEYEIIVFEHRPLGMYTQIPISAIPLPPVNGMVNVIPIKGGKIDGVDHNHFYFGHLIDIAEFLLKKQEYAPDPHDVDLANRAIACMWPRVFEYYQQPNSFLSLKSQFPYGDTGRCRKAACILWTLRDCFRIALLKRDFAILTQVINAIQLHLKAILSNWPLLDGPQGDGLLIPHFRSFQLAMLGHAAKANVETFNFNSTIIQDLESIVNNVSVAMVHSASRDNNGNVLGVWYDFPLQYVPNPWPGEKLKPDNGVEPWTYAFQTQDVRAFLEAENASLPNPVRVKFGMMMKP